MSTAAITDVKSQAARSSSPADALRSCWLALGSVGAITATINILYLTGSFFMLEVYDRVIPSRSFPTLVGLSVLAGALYAFQGALDLIRGRLLVRVGVSIDSRLNAKAFDAVVRLPLLRDGTGAGLQPVRDLDQVRGFLSGQGPAALFDLPWLPLYLGICFLFHPYIGLTALVGGLILVSLTLVTELLSRAPAGTLTDLSQRRMVIADAARRNAEVLRALGMQDNAARRWLGVNAGYQDAQRRTADIAGGLGALSKVIRMALQSAVLAVGAYLVIEQQASAGIIIASSVLTSRALAPVELAIANWKGFIAARQSWARLGALLSRIEDKSAMALPAPTRVLSVESVSAAPPSGQKLVIHDVAFELPAGSAVGVIGPSASGKSSLARTIVGVWTPMRGKVRLDGAALDQWAADALGRHIGYLPQDVELFAGTVAENIARLEADADPETVIAAARAAGVHEMIVRLSDGYETQIGEGGASLSAGQRQRIGLARALYRDPFLVVLDEPNSNLDSDGEQALTHAILGVRARQGIVVVIAHRPSALAGVDYALVMAEGRMQGFGLKEEVLGRFLRPVPVAVPSDLPRPALAAAI